MPNEQHLSTPADAALAEAFDRLRNTKAAKAVRDAQISLALAKRRRLLAVLDGARWYSNSGSRDEFVSGWARHWRVAARAWGLYGPKRGLAAVQTPESPEYQIAMSIFRLALRRASVARIESELAKALHALWDDPTIHALRLHFGRLHDAASAEPIGGAEAAEREPVSPPSAQHRPAAGEWNVEVRNGTSPRTPSLLVTFTLPSGERRQSTLRGATTTRLFLAVASQAGQELRWDELSRQFTTGGTSTSAAVTLERTGRRVRERLPEALRFAWSQSKSGVRLQAELVSQGLDDALRLLVAG